MPAGLNLLQSTCHADLLHEGKAKFCVEYLFTVASESMDEYFRLGEIFPIFLGEISTTNILIRSHARYWTLKYVLYMDAKTKMKPFSKHDVPESALEFSLE